jgi:bifunctional enzyme CysN/CysC
MSQNSVRTLELKNSALRLSTTLATEADKVVIEDILQRNRTASLLRFSTAGSVDDGKSTLIGRLLHDSKNLFEDQLNSFSNNSGGSNGALSLALVTDGLKAEREQGITIDVAYRYFSTGIRRFILADTPGHEQYTRNMATGSSRSDLSIILIDARKGILAQTRRHAFIAALLGVPQFIVAVNKMDLVDYSKQVFEKIGKEFSELAEKLGIKCFQLIPISALKGDNVVTPTKEMPWYEGPTILEHLERVEIEPASSLEHFRFPVQYTIFANGDHRAYAGQIASGVIHVGDEVTVLPSFKKSRIKAIEVTSPGLKQNSAIAAHAPMSVSLSLTDELDIARGDMLALSTNLPQSSNRFEAMVVWMDDQAMNPNRYFILRHTTSEVKAYVEKVAFKYDIDNFSSLPADTLHMNEIGRLSVNTTSPVFFDSYRANRATGSFILIDPATFRTVAAGMVVESGREENLHRTKEEASELKRVRPANLHQEKSAIENREREKRFGHRACTIWLTGLSGSGKSSIAKALERNFFEEGVQVYRLDGDNLRYGLNRDLGFSEEDRIENIRRAAEVARLFNEAGMVVLCAFISPFARDREAAAQIIGKDRFIEVFVDTPLSVCEQRDPHGLYKRARCGEIKEFTGVSSPYEAPHQPDIRIDTSNKSVEDCLAMLREPLQNLIVPSYLNK